MGRAEIGEINSSCPSASDVWFGYYNEAIANRYSASVLASTYVHEMAHMADHDLTLALGPDAFPVLWTEPRL